MVRKGKNNDDNRSILSTSTAPNKTFIRMWNIPNSQSIISYNVFDRIVFVIHPELAAPSPNSPNYWYEIESTISPPTPQIMNMISLSQLFVAYLKLSSIRIRILLWRDTICAKILLNFRHVRCSYVQFDFIVGSTFR